MMAMTTKSSIKVKARRITGVRIRAEREASLAYADESLPALTEITLYCAEWRWERLVVTLSLVPGVWTSPR